MDLKMPEGFYLRMDSNGNAEMSVRFRRENIPYLSKALAIVDDILAIDEEPDADAALASTTQQEES